MSSPKPHVLLMGQTPPPWHGQAVATRILFDHEWPDFGIHRLRMEYSEEMLEVGRLQWKKVIHLIRLIRAARRVLRANPDSVLFYPPASAKWIPFLRDVIFLMAVRPLAGSTVFIFHASGLPVFCTAGPIRRFLSRLAYHRPDVALEVAREAITPHDVFDARASQWCPCAIDVPNRRRQPKPAGTPVTVLFVGSLQEGKGVLEIMRTADALKRMGHESRFRFRVVGKWFSAEFERNARALLDELGVGSMVELTGQLTGDSKWDAYFSADVFFFPTHYESEATPIVLMEALGAGLPIVSTEWAGIPAMLKGCPTSRLLPVRSPQRYAAAMVAIMADLDRGIDFAGPSQSYYDEHFLPESFIKRVANAFRIAADHHPAVKSGPHQHKEPIRDSGTAPPSDHPVTTSPITLSVYLADQNPGHDRSFGISRMSQVVLDALLDTGKVKIETISSRTSQHAPGRVGKRNILPWGTRRKFVRLLTDHFHPLFAKSDARPDVHYFPKGYLPFFDAWCSPSVVTIHDTIIQYDEDHYPTWRKPWEYAYWSLMLKHTLRNADRIMTVSESSRRQILAFMARHGIPLKEIVVTYEPCLYEHIEQPENPEKENYVIHLASCEPHKRTAHLVHWWSEAEEAGRKLPMLHLIGKVPEEVRSVLERAKRIAKRPFLTDEALQAAYIGARALVLPSEIEGFGLPALEAYYLGTPVCFVKGTSVGEILGEGTAKGAFTLDDHESLFSALDEVMAMSPAEIRNCGLKLRETHAAGNVTARMMRVFEEVTARG
jgi:glycosyltransferase involved in cell wall biosynthesis